MKYYKVLILAISFLLFFSCKVIKNEVVPDVDGFKYKKYSDKQYELLKIPSSLTIGKEKYYESEYTILIPNKILEYSTTISKIPNEICFEYRGNQNIYVLENKNNLKKYSKLNLNKEDFTDEISKFKISNMKFEKKLTEIKSNRLNGINIIDDYILIYTNVKKAELEIFNKSIQSFKLIKDGKLPN